MLALLFYLGDAMYTITCEKVREIVPMMALKAVPQSPDFFAGFFNYRGIIVPVIDLSCLIRGQSCRMRLSTRIVLADYAGRGNTPYLLGLMAERVTETIRLSEEALSPAMHLEDAPYMGGIIMKDRQMIQHIDLDRLPDCIGLLPEAQKGSCHALQRH